MQAKCLWKCVFKAIEPKYSVIVIILISLFILNINVNASLSCKATVRLELNHPSY